MQLSDADVLLAVYGDLETMQHLSSDLPATVAEARAWVRVTGRNQCPRLAGLLNHS